VKGFAERLQAELSKLSPAAVVVQVRIIYYTVI